MMYFEQFDKLYSCTTAVSCTVRQPVSHLKGAVVAELLGGAEDDHLVLRTAALSAHTKEKKVRAARQAKQHVINREIG